MSSTHMVRSVIDGCRRNSRVAEIRRHSAFGGTVSDSTNANAVSDDEDDDECNIGINESANSSPSRSLSPATSENGRSNKILNEGSEGGNVCKTSTARKDQNDVVFAAPLPTPKDLSAVEDREEEEKPWYLQVMKHLIKWSIDPDGLLYFYWKSILTLAVMYNYVIIILRIAFDELKNEISFSRLDVVCDLIYMLDFLIESKSCYLSNGSLIVDSGLTLQNYLGKNIFMLDVIAVIPMRIFIVTIAGLCKICGFPILLLQNYFTIIEPTFRLNRLAKTHIMNSFFYKTESRSNSPNFLRAVRLGIQLALVIHWMACLYYMISVYEGLGSSEWAYPSDPEYSAFHRKYIVCMYWSIMTLTTIGERPSPVTSLEYIFTGLTFLIGVFVFAAVVGNVGDVISNMNAARRDFQTRMDQIKFYLNHRQVPESLQTRIKRWAEYTWDRTKAVDEPSVLQWLPDRLRTEVAIYVHLSVLKKVSIFDECEEGLLRELVLKLKPQIYSPGDYICRIGEIGREMYIINHGQVEILFPDVETGAMQQVAVMQPGNFFGEISLLKLDDGQNKRTADVRSIGFSELLCLSRRDLMVALTEYPDAKRILEEYARERFHQTKKQNTSRDGSSNNSPRESVTSTNSPMSARQVFAKVMKKEGFASLLKRKDTDLMAIKTAVEELKATNSSEVHQTFVSLHKEIQDMSKQVIQRDVEMQQARAEIAYLKSIISDRFSPERHINGTQDGSMINGEEENSNFPSYYPEKNGMTRTNICPRSPSDDQRFRNQFNSLDNNDSLDTYNNVSFLGNSSELELNSEPKNVDRSIDVDSSFNSSEGGSSDEDLDLLEEKFDQIGKNGEYKVSSKRSVSMNVLSDLCKQPSNIESRRKFSVQLNTSNSFTGKLYGSDGL